MQQLILLGVVFLIVLWITVATYQFVNRRRLTTEQAARERLGGRQTATAAASILREDKVSDSPLLERLLTGRAITARLQAAIARSGVDTNPGAIVSMSVASAAVAYFAGATFLAPAFGLLCGLGGLFVPTLWLGMRAKSRANKFEEQLPDAIDMLVNAMRAGYSFQHAMRFIGEEMDAPLGPEFARFYEEQRLGLDVRSALLALQERVGGMDIKMFLTAVLIQRDTGGNLSEVLNNIGGVIRERFAIRGEIATLTAQGKMSARIMAALPVLVYLATTALNPQYMRQMRESPAGMFMLGSAAVLVIVGYFALMRLANVEI